MAEQQKDSILRDILKSSNKPITSAPGWSRGRGVVCCASGCGNSEREHPGKVFYVFPTAQDSWIEWLKAIDRLDLTETLESGIPDDIRVCSDHFADHHYNFRRALRDDAVPSLMVSNDVGTVTIKQEIENSIEIEFEAEEWTHNVDPTAEEPITIKIENQSTEIDPLALVKSEPPIEAATQTFPRKELYLSVATTTEPEHINLPPVYVERDNRSVHVQTTKNLINHFVTPVKRKLEAEIRDVNKKIRKMQSDHMDKQKFAICCDKYLNEKIANIVKSHSHIQDKYVGNRYGKDFKTFAHNLYLSNPQSYKFVEQIFSLPSRGTLRRLQRPARTGINRNLMEYLRNKVKKMSEKEKVCAICFDVMHIAKNLWYEPSNDFFCGMQEIDQVMGPEPAEYAAVLIVRGLYTQWTQPVSFAFMTEKRYHPELKEWLHKIIGTMFDIGLNIKVFVSDLETKFMDVFVQPDLHHFEIDGRRIYQFYDAKYLFRDARDALMQYNFHVDSKIVQWSHISKVYDKDQNHELSLMPKITDEHMRPTGKSLEKANLAIEVFSKPVAAAMSFFVTTNMVNEKYRDTLEFVANMSNLNDFFTSKTGAYEGTIEQNEFLLSILEYLNDIEVKDRHGSVIESRFVTGMIVNIRSIMALIEDLKQESLDCLFTKMLSKDCAEAFFDECRRLGGNCCERPTGIMFARSFRRLFLVNLVYNTQDGQNEQDLKTTLHQIGDFTQADLLAGKNDEPETERNRFTMPGFFDFKIQWPSTEYIAGYLLWKCLEKHKCPAFIGRLSSHYDIPVEEDAATLLKNFKKYDADHIDRLDLWKPPTALVEFIDHIDGKYYQYFSDTERGPVNFGWNAYLTMEEDTFELPCECFPLKFIKMLFIKLRIEHSVREFNKVNKNPRRAKHQQMKMKPKKKKNA